jgi:shikimate kinase
VTPLLVLVGPPTSGKTTVGRAVAARLGVPFTDTDAVVEAEAGTSVADLFVERGEPVFRELEERAVASSLAGADGVLALGGGAVTSAATRALLVERRAAGGAVVRLEVDLHTAAQRAGFNRDRPLLAVNPRAVLRAQLEQRAPLYAEVATAAVSTVAREVDDVVTEVLALLPAVPGAAR